MNKETSHYEMQTHGEWGKDSSKSNVYDTWNVFRQWPRKIQSYKTCGIINL